MAVAEADGEANRLIDLRIRGREWLATGEPPVDREAILGRLREIDKYEQDASTASPAHVAWQEGQAAVKAFWASGSTAAPTISALATIVADGSQRLLRRQVAAEILSEGPLDGKAADTMVACLRDADPEIQYSALQALFRVPKEMFSAAASMLVDLCGSAHVRVARAARAKLVNLPFDQGTTDRIVELFKARRQAGSSAAVVSLLEGVLRNRGVDPSGVT